MIDRHLGAAHHFGKCPLWHLADNPAAPAVVRFWTKADKVDFGVR
jgi:hypothetical protein